MLASGHLFTFRPFGCYSKPQGKNSLFSNKDYSHSPERSSRRCAFFPAENTMLAQPTRISPGVESSHEKRKLCKIITVVWAAKLNSSVQYLLHLLAVQWRCIILNFVCELLIISFEQIYSSNRHVNVASGWKKKSRVGWHAKKKLHRDKKLFLFQLFFFFKQ